jgi:hypothetical protein
MRQWCTVHPGISAIQRGHTLALPWKGVKGIGTRIILAHMGPMGPAPAGAMARQAMPLSTPLMLQTGEAMQDNGQRSVF